MIGEQTSEEHPLATVVESCDRAVKRWRGPIFVNQMGILANAGFLIIRCLDLYSQVIPAWLAWFCLSTHLTAGLICVFALRRGLRQRRKWANLRHCCLQVISANTWSQTEFFTEQAACAIQQLQMP